MDSGFQAVIVLDVVNLPHPRAIGSVYFGLIAGGSELECHLLFLALEPIAGGFVEILLDFKSVA